MNKSIINSDLRGTSKVNSKYIKLLILSGIMLVTSLLSIQPTYAATLQEQMNNLTGPKQQYNTMLSPAYLRNNTSDESVSAQSGELSLAQTDYVLPGINGLDVEIKRIYRSGTANVRDMKVEYVNGVWVDQVYSDNSTSSFYEERYNLGAGMRLSFPTMEIKKNNDGSSYKFLHTEAGDVYRLIGPEKVDNINTYTPENQTIKDVTIKENSSFNNGQSDGTSFYVMTNKTGKNTYFSEDGRILGIVDRYGNTIKFHYTTSTYTVDGSSKTKKLITKIIDTIGREINIEYKEDQSFTVGPIENTKYTLDDSYKASQNPNSSDSGDLKGKFQVVITLPDGNKIVYDKTAVLVNSSKHVIRTRLQRVFDIDGSPKYHFWYDQPDLGFTYTNGTTYSAYNRYENLTQIDFCRTNRIEKFTYNTYTKRLSDGGSMQYRKICEQSELEKKGFDSTKSSFMESFITSVKDKVTYAYTNEADGYGFSGYNDTNSYLKDTYRYYTDKSLINGTKTKYTYNGLGEQVISEETGTDHKMSTVTEFDEMKFPKKIEKITTSLLNGQIKGAPYKEIENFRYDMYGDLTNYTGPEAKRDDKGYPVDSENTVVFTYAYDKYHVLTSKTWKQDKDTTSQLIYTVDAKGNVIKEEKVHTSDKDNWLVTDFKYDKYGNMTQRTVYSQDNNYITNYEYGKDYYGVDQKGAYLTKQYTVVDGNQQVKSYAYEFKTGNMISEIDENSNKTSYHYDDLYRITKIEYPDLSSKQYKYLDYKDKNRQIQYIDENNNSFMYQYDVFGNQLEYSTLLNDTWTTLLTDEYDSQGNKIKEIDSNGNSIRFEYTSQNMPSKKEYYQNDKVKKDTQIFSYTYGPDASSKLLLAITDEDGYDKRYYFDAKDRLTKIEETPDKTKYYTTTSIYNYSGNLVAQTDARGNTTVFTYDDIGRLISKKDALNNEIKYTYNSLNSPILLEEPDQRVVQKLYDEKGRLTEERVYKKDSPDEYTYKRCSYDSADNMISQTEGTVSNKKDTVSAQSENKYDSMGRPVDQYVGIDKDRKAHINIKYDKNGNKVLITEYVNQQENSAIKHSYEYDFSNRVTREVASLDDQSSYTNQFSYDLEGNKLTHETFNGVDFDIVSFKYDYRNRIIQKVEPFIKGGDNKISQYSYDKRGNLLSESISVSGSINTTQYQYDGLSKVTAMIDPMGYATKYLYDQNGNMIKTIDPRYSAMDAGTAPGIEYEYDAFNRPFRTTVFDGTSRSVISYRQYDNRGNLTLDVDGEGYNKENPTASAGKSYTYDAQNRVIAVKTAQVDFINKKNGTDTYSSIFTYDGSSRVLSQKDAYGNATKNVYYLNGLIKQKTYPDGTTESYEYDDTGRTMTILTDRAGYKSTVYQNIFGKPYKSIFADNSMQLNEYSPDGLLTKSTDRMGNAKTFEYDLLGNCILKKELQSSENGADCYRLTKTTYNELGNAISIETFQLIGSEEISADNRVTYSYDKNSRLLKVNGPLSRETVNEYDKCGNLITKKEKQDGNAYIITRNVYDIQSRLVESELLVNPADLDNNSIINVEFDKEYKELIKSKTIYSYNKNNQLISKTDANGNISKIEYDLDNRPVKKIDAKGNATSYQYDYNGNILQEKNAKDIVTSYEYDSMSRLIRKISPAADGDVAVTRYVYDSMGNLVKQIDPNNYNAQKDTAELVDTMLGYSYIYDCMNRRTATISPVGQGVEYFSYNANGNIIKKVDGLRYTTDIQSSKGTSYTYDAMGNLIEATDALGNSSSIKYDILGSIISKSDENGNVTQYRYNADRTLAEIIFADGGQVSYTYDLLGRKTRQIDQLGNETAFSYNSFGTLKQTVDAYGNTTLSKVDLVGNVVITKDKRGSQTYVTYDQLNRPIRKKIPFEADASGSIIYSVENYTYDELGRVVTTESTSTKTGQQSRTVNYTYYSNGLVNTVTDNAGAYSRTYYDKNGNATKIERLRDGSNYDIQLLEYDSLNRLVRDIKLVDEQDIYNASSLSAVDDLRDSKYPGKIKLITAYEYDLLGNRIKQISPLGFAYTENDIREMNSISYSYDELNRLISTTRSYENTTVSQLITYDKAGNKQSQTDERGNATTYAYDKMNRISATTDPLNNTYTITYDKAGNKISETNAKNQTMTYAYDKLNRLTTVTDAYDKVISCKVYDQNGNVVKDIDAKGYKSGSSNETRYGSVYTYNLANLLVSKSTPEAVDKGATSIRYTYSIFGEVLTQTDALGNVTTYQYDNAGNLIKVIDPLKVSIKYTYDRLGNKQTMTNGKGKLTLYSYSAFGMLRFVKNEEDKTISYQYDLLGNVACQTDKSGNHTLFTYSNIGQLLEKRVIETGDVIKYSYDQVGNRSSMQDSCGTATYEYDKLNHLVQKNRNGSLQLAYQYDELGNIIKVTDGKSNETLYTYDKSNRMETVTRSGQTTTYSYDENGRRTEIEYPSGITEQYTFDKDNQLISLENDKSSGVNISKYSYTYDLAGRQTSKTDSYGTTNYSYDSCGRIVKVSAPGKTTLYSYDNNGNRANQAETYTSAQPSGYIDASTSKEIQYMLKKSIYTYSNADQLLKLVEVLYDENSREIARKTTKYIYDSNGNQLKQSTSCTLTDNTQLRPVTNGTAYGEGITDSINAQIEKVSYTYDGFNRLVSAETIKLGKRTIAKYVYNGDDLRESKTVIEGDKTEQTYYTYDRQHVILETDAAGNQKASYIKGINYIAKADSKGNTAFYLYNGHGDVVQMVDSTGEIINQYDYDIWGNPTLTIETAANAIRYAGEFMDTETGMYYLRARYYDPYTGRFVSEDSYWGEDKNPLSLNLYTYCHNDPIMFTDPDGHAVAKLGTKGETIKAIKEDLKQLGYKVSSGDKFDAQTQAAVIKFQKDNGLQADGIVGNQTLTEIYFEQSKKAAKAQGFELPEQQKAKVGQLSGDVVIMTDKSYEKAIKNITELKANTNNGSVNTTTVNNTIAVSQVTIGSKQKTDTPITITPTKSSNGNVVLATDDAGMAKLNQQTANLTSVVTKSTAAIQTSETSANTSKPQNYLADPKTQMISGLAKAENSKVSEGTGVSGFIESYIGGFTNNFTDKYNYYEAKIQKGLSDPLGLAKENILEGALIPIPIKISMDICTDIRENTQLIINGDLNKIAEHGGSGSADMLQEVSIALISGGAAKVKASGSINKIAVEGTPNTAQGMLKKNGIPSTLTDEEIAVADSVGLQMKMTSKQATEAANKLGFEKTNYTSHGQPVFKKGNTYITPDVDGHNGGTWKAAGSVKDLGSKSTRWGTYDANLNRIGD